MVTALASASSGLGFCLSRGHCVVNCVGKVQPDGPLGSRFYECADEKVTQILLSSLHKARHKGK